MHRYKYLPLIVATLIGCGENSNVPPEHDAATLWDLSVVVDAGVVDLLAVDLPVVDLAAVDLPVVISDAAPVDSALPSCSAVDCPSPSPICDVAAGACRACNSDSDDAQCQTRSVATPHCRQSNAGGPNVGTCVQCNSDQDCNQTLAPICDLTGTCRGCVAHSECASTVCITDTGLCADTNDVAYIDNGGDSISDCKKINRVHDGAPAHPYCDIVDGVAAGNPYLRVTGHLGFPYTPLSFTASVNLIIVGPGAGVTNPATLTDGNNSDVAISLSGSSSVTLILDGLELGDRSLQSNNQGLFCAVTGGAAASVTLRNDTVRQANNTGVSSSGCALVISSSTITNNGNDGLLINGGTVTVSGSTFGNNSGAAAINLAGTLTATFSGNTINGNTLGANTTPGVVVNGSTTIATLIGNTISGHGGDAVVCSGGSNTTLIGNTISKNKQGVSSNASTLTLDSNRIFGSTGTGAFGVDVENASTFTLINNFIYANPGLGVKMAANSTGKFVFNTVVENGGGGVDCGGGGGTSKPLEASIVWGNQPAGGTQFPNNNCKLLETVTGTDNFSGAIQSTPTFVNPSPTPGPIDLHLQINSAANTACCIDKVGGQLDGGSPLPDHDIDSDHRPRGAGYDVGGDEAQ